MRDDLPAPLVCAGRPLTREGQPVGDPCGRTFTARPVAVAPPDDGSWPPWATRAPTAEEQDGQARAGRWSVGVLPDGSRAATCPTCRRPDPELTAICRELQKGPHA